MKVNPLFTEIIKGTWLLDVHQLDMYAPIVDKILSGESITGESIDPSAVMNLVDADGNPLQRNNDDEMIISENSIANVYAEGEITKNGGFCHYGARDIVAALYKAQSYENVDATIFHIDGPGGSTSAIGPFREFAKNKTKPVIGLIDQALSLHYWAAISVCDFIIADNDVSARFGSVGIVASFIDARKAMELKGYKLHTVYPEESKHKNEAFHLALDGKYDMIKKELLSPLAIKFQDSVVEALPNIRKEEEGVLTGKTFGADKALGLNMIHGIGGYKLALEKAHQLAFEYKIKSNLVRM